MIEIRNLDFRYDKIFSLNIENFVVKKGENVFLSGESGSGKSTLLSIITGILNYKSGSVKILGQELNALSELQKDNFRGQNIGFIFQQFNLIPYLSVKENILLPCKFFNKSFSSLEKLLKKIDLDKKYWDKRVDELSIGQQQRVACVRAIIGNPKIVIADEPTSALDRDRQDIFLELLIDCCKDIDSTLLFVSHNQELSKKFDRIIRIKDGKIIN